MPVERSAGAIIFRKEDGKAFFLLLHYPGGSRAKKDYWDLPKGHIEKGEDEISAVKREVREETGLSDIDFVKGFKKIISYFFKRQGKTVLKFVTFYLAGTAEKEIKISGEHTGFQWLSYQEAINRLTYKNAREILEKANNFLSGKGL
jgi:bis(5'-nucleosidyl)-tetraphosphatase